MRRIMLWGLLGWLLLFLPPLTSAQERADGQYFSIVDEQGQIVYKTGWAVAVGDQVLTEQNRRYEVTSCEGNTAHARFLGQQTLSVAENDTWWWSWEQAWDALPTLLAESNRKVAIYHTHTDESYIPTDGTESIDGNGGILKVGQAFQQALQAKGLDAVQSTTRHEPHDNMAYERSRRTVLTLLKREPDAIFDVHRDAVPPEVYQGQVAGEDISKVQLVVGKYGPTGKQIEDYALRIKALADQQHPGLIKGIFFAKGGDYNQDLHPRSMLLEVGAHTNSRESAERGIALFADVVPSILSGTQSNPANPTGAAGLGTKASGPSGAVKSIGWLIALLVGVSVIYLIVSSGGVKQAGAKWQQFIHQEFANFIGKRVKQALPKKPKKHPDENQ